MDALSIPQEIRTAAGGARPPLDQRRTVNDVHSQLNATRVSRVLAPRTIAELRDQIGAASVAGSPVSMCGARHSMGGQQFASGRTLLDLSGLNRLIEIDPDRGLVTVEAGIDWVTLIDSLHRALPRHDEAWSIVQKQTGADRLTIGGALSSNVHGRGLRLPPIVGDVESFDLIDADGCLQCCSRTRHPRLFSLAIGGYGLFGAIARVTLRLARRRKVERRVTIACISDLPRLFDQRIREGYEYGDCQFATDPLSREFLESACSRAIARSRPTCRSRWISGACRRPNGES